MVSAVNTLSAALALLALVLIAMPLGTDAIKCYQCRSKDNSVCGQDLPANPGTTHPGHRLLVDCDVAGNVSTAETRYQKDKFTFCRKQYQEVDGKVNIIRACGLVKGDRDCYSTANPPTKTLVCQCFTDGCNAAGSVTVSMAMVLAATGLAAVNWMRH